VFDDPALAWLVKKLASFYESRMLIVVSAEIDAAHKQKFRGLSPRVNYTDRGIADCGRS
jgi:hypothetical protein